MCYINKIEFVLTLTFHIGHTASKTRVFKFTRVELTHHIFTHWQKLIHILTIILTSDRGQTM